TRQGMGHRCRFLRRLRAIPDELCAAGNPGVPAAADPSVTVRRYARAVLGRNVDSLREVVDAGLLSGAVTMVWQRGEVLQLNEIGYRDVEAGLPMQRDTIFRIAS